MEKNEIFKFMNSNPAFHLATIEGDKPHVRGMFLYRADEKGIIFHSGKQKDLHGQIMKNPNVELCFINAKELAQVRVSGLAESVDDIELKKEIVGKREFLKPLVDKSGYDSLSVYRVSNLRATVWSMAHNMEPKEFIDL